MGIFRRETLECRNLLDTLYICSIVCILYTLVDGGLGCLQWAKTVRCFTVTVDQRLYLVLFAMSFLACRTGLLPRIVSMSAMVAAVSFGTNCSTWTTDPAALLIWPRQSGRQKQSAVSLFCSRRPIWYELTTPKVGDCKSELTSCKPIAWLNFS